MGASTSPRAARPQPQLRTIGDVLTELRAEFPDISHSKIRFLEDQGLVEPARTASGYRKFNASDVERLRTVLALQRDRYMPLRVIREYLEALDRGLEPPEVPGGSPRAPRVVATNGVPDADAFHAEPSRVRLTRAELRESAQVDEEDLAQLETYGLVRAGANGWYGLDALETATVAGELRRYGIEARHLRFFRTAAEREVSLVEQVVSPMRRQRQAGAGPAAEQVARDISALCVRLHATLVRHALDGAGG